jgi:hypothetical protein
MIGQTLRSAQISTNSLNQPIDLAYNSLESKFRAKPLGCQEAIDYLILGCASWQPYVVALIGLLAPSTEPISFSIEPVISLVYKVNIPHEADPPGCTNFFKISIDEFERADDPCNSIYTGRDGTSEGDDA